MSGMRPRLPLALALAASFSTPPLRAQGAAAAPPAEDAGGGASAPASPAKDPKAEARSHFDLGVKLFRDGNYAGALAEFEAAYRLRPTVGALQNVALSQKGLFRYAEAADTLERLLRDHGAALGDDGRQRVESAIRELQALVGTLVITVSPASARVSVDGRAYDATARRNGIRVNVGEHRIQAEAQGYGTLEEMVRVAGGQRRDLQLQLRPTKGFLTVHVDGQGAISVDGTTVGSGSWEGPVTPGRHIVRIARPGYEAFEEIVNVGVGKRVTLEGKVGEPVKLRVGPSTTSPAPPADRSLQGWYVLGGFSVVVPSEAPVAIVDDGLASSAASGGGLALHGGYRLSTLFGAELYLAGTRNEVEGVGLDGGPDSVDYTLGTFRTGIAGRFNTSGEVFRLTGLVGIGAVNHNLEVREGGGDALADGRAAGWDLTLAIQAGVQFNFGHVLLEPMIIANIDWGENVTGAYVDQYAGSETSAYPNGLRMVGLGLRVGWSQWRPPEVLTSRAATPSF